MKMDLTGQRFNRLTVIGHAGVDNRRHTLWHCRCDCGREVITTGQKLKSGNTKSCGCLRVEVARSLHFVHGGKGTRLYNIWKGAKQRCRNPKATDYELYGGRGIIFSEVWDDFKAFKAWAESSGYSDELTLDRIDPNGNYSPDNCRWVTWADQRHNQRRSKGVVL